jgi:hypothetical protein
VKYDYISVKNIYIICGKTDMRKGIDGLATLIQDSFELDPYGDSIFLFAGWSKDRYKCLYFDGEASPCSINVWITANSNGLKMKRKYAIFHNRSYAGSLKGYQSSSQRRFNHHQKVRSKFVKPLILSLFLCSN